MVCSASLENFFNLNYSGLGIRSLVFRANRSFFCERKSKIVICSFPSVNHSWSLFLKSDGVKSDGSVSLKRGKAVKNCQKHGENHELFGANRSFLRVLKEQKCYALKKRANHSCHSLFKEQGEWIPHRRSLRRVILSQKANSQPWNYLLLRLLKKCKFVHIFCSLISLILYGFFYR